MKKIITSILAAFMIGIATAPVFAAPSSYVIVNNNSETKTVSAISTNGNYVQIKLTKFDRNGNPTEGRVDGGRVFISSGNFTGPDGNTYSYRAIPENDVTMSIRYFFN